MPHSTRVLVIVELNDRGGLRSASLSAITFARALCRQLSTGYALMVLGSGIAELVGQLRAFGADRVLASDAPEFQSPLAEMCVPTIAEAVKRHSFEFVVGAATSTGKDWLARLAGHLDIGYISDCVGVTVSEGAATFRRPINAGNVYALCQCSSSQVAISVRQAEFEPAKSNGALSPVEPTQPAARTEASKRIQNSGFESVNSTRPELSEARVVVSGGRALSGRFFEILGPLADLLGAAIGATRAACDAGFAPGDFQVGQTGKVVAPELYVAVGISGAIQHLAGIRGARTVVAINSDPKAPIFNVADYGLVGDLFKIVPELVGAIASHRAGEA